MPPFLQFRLWLSGGPARERVLVGAALTLFAVLLLLASLPLADSDSGVDTVAGGELQEGTSGTEDGVGGVDAAPASTSADTSGETPSGAAASAGQSGASSSVPPAGDAAAPAAGGDEAAVPTARPQCAGLAASAPGITAEQVLVDASIVSLAGPVGNTAFNIRPDQHEVIDAVVAEINRTGGVACGRTLVVKKYDVNPIDQNDQQSKCLRMKADNPFVVIDFAGYVRPVGRSCFVQNELPMQISITATAEEIEGGYPYLYGAAATSDKAVRDGILGAARQGFFRTPKFQKLGLLTEACSDRVNQELKGALSRSGVEGGKISEFTTSCQLVSPPSEILQAVLQHKSANATHVFLASSLSNNQRYTTIAAQQDFFPTYAASDYGSATTSSGSFDASFDGAIAETSARRGEIASGARNARVERCHRILTEAGLPGIETEKDDGVALLACDQFFFFRQAIDNAGANPTQRAFVETGVGTMGRFESAAVGDGEFDRRGKVVGGDFHRPLRYKSSCTCWTATGTGFEPGY